MNEQILTIVTFLPTVGALILLFLREEMKQGARDGFAERLEQALVRLPPQAIVRVEPPSPSAPLTTPPPRG
jgi:hypothetical protein